MADPELVRYFRCPDEYADIHVRGPLSRERGYFAFRDVTCFGHLAGDQPAPRAGTKVPRAVAAFDNDGTVSLPFDLSEVIGNLRLERYATGPDELVERLTSTTLARGFYYLLRPLLAVQIRKHLQRLRLSGWDRIAFPRWPVDSTVDTLMRSVLGLMLKGGNVERVPFVWFWPDGAEGCVMMTHDVESPAGLEFCSELMDLDDSFGLKSAFQVVPEMPGATSGGWEQIRGRGFELNLHDLNHDGTLFQDEVRFRERAAQINRYGRILGCEGFRSGAMYRQQAWFDALEFAYDMSVPTVAHLEPQRGGCCTVMPYFVGNLLELPLTTTQDYSLFHIIGDYSITLWKRQLELILAANGLASFIAHPDYLVEPRARRVYSELLAHLSELRAAGRIWAAMPAEINRWWRSRDAMALVPDGDGWRVEGPLSERARVAYATLADDEVVYTLEPPRGQRR